MNFNSINTSFDLRHTFFPSLKREQRRSFYKKLVERANLIKEEQNKCNMLFTLVLEEMWIEENRPYYKLYPSMYDAFSKIKLEIKGDELFSSSMQDVMLIRFAAGREPKCGSVSIQSILAAIVNVPLSKICPDGSSDYAKKLIFLTWDDLIGKNKIPNLGNVTLNSESICNRVDYSKANDTDIQVFHTSLKFIITTFLLQNDPSIIQPDVLVADRNRFDRSTDLEERQRLIDKAKRRGIVGWRIGEQYETMPHYRRPHFGLRHTGKGKTVPRIVPIKGAIVHRQKMTQVPTGYLLEDGTEIED